MSSTTRIGPFVMSLALSSHDIPMASIVRAMGLVAKHLHERGEPINNPKYPSLRPATKHYASAANARSSEDRDVSAWLAGTLGRLDSHPALPDLMRSGQVEATLWIATLGADPAPPPVQVDPNHVAAATRLGARIMLEDYNRFDDGGVPLKTWLT